jgi:hypothetical protein
MTVTMSVAVLVWLMVAVAVVSGAVGALLVRWHQERERWLTHRQQQWDANRLRVQRESLAAIGRVAMGATPVTVAGSDLPTRDEGLPEPEPYRPVRADAALALAAVRGTDTLIEASSLGTPEAVAARESVTARGELTGMGPEQADWDDSGDPYDVFAATDDPVEQPEAVTQRAERRRDDTDTHPPVHRFPWAHLRGEPLPELGPWRAPLPAVLKRPIRMLRRYSTWQVLDWRRRTVWVATVAAAAFGSAVVMLRQTPAWLAAVPDAARAWAITVEHHGTVAWRRLRSRREATAPPLATESGGHAAWRRGCRSWSEIAERRVNTWAAELRAAAKPVARPQTVASLRLRSDWRDLLRPAKRTPVATAPWIGCVP